MVFADTASRKLLNGLQTAVADAGAGISFRLNGLWPLIRLFFANLVATVASAVHEPVLLFEKLWEWLQTSNALPVVLGLAAILCLVAMVCFCLPFLCAAAVGVGRALVYVVCFCGQCLYLVAVGVGRVLACVLPSCVQCCVDVTMNAPGAAGTVISRAAFVANPQLYFQILRLAGGVVASAVFCTTTIASVVAAPVAALFRA